MKVSEIYPGHPASQVWKVMIWQWWWLWWCIPATQVICKKKLKHADDKNAHIWEIKIWELNEIYHPFVHDDVQDNENGDNDDNDNGENDDNDK